MFKVNKEEGKFTYPQQLLEKAGSKYYPNVDFTLNCEPVFANGEPYWAFDNYRLKGTNPGANYLFYTQPGWGSHFETMYPRTKIKCVTYAHDPEIHFDAQLDKEYDVGFIGEFAGIESDRKEYLKALVENFNCYFSENTPTTEISTALSKCKILFNHIRSEEVNIRFFETLAIGTQVCSYTPALHYLVPDDCYVTFSSIEDCVSKIKELLKKDELRFKIQRRAQKAVKEHTYKKRVEEMLQFVNLI